MKEHNCHEHDEHNKHERGGHEHMGPESAPQFLAKFKVVTFLLVPMLLLTPTALKILGISDFPARPYLMLALATVVFYQSFIFFTHARHEIKAKQYGMMTLVSIAVLAGYLFSLASTFAVALEAEFYLEISTLIWVLLFGHYLEARSSAGASEALKSVEQLLPQNAYLQQGSEFIKTNVSDLKKDDIVRVRSGEKVPADGVLIQGTAGFDESFISGESKPVMHQVKDNVLAGSICLQKSVLVKITRVGEGSTVGQIKKLIATAQTTKPKSQRLADKAAKYLTFIALITAILSILIWSVLLGEPFVFSITLAITVLVIACPHALGLAIPTVTTIGTSLAVKNGLFIKNLEKLETAQKTTHIVFDKTGTLTEGKFKIKRVVNFTSVDVLPLVASLEQHSSHIIGQTIVEYAKKKSVKLSAVTSFTDLTGQGVQGVINETKYYAGNKELMLEHNVFQSESEINEAGTIIYVASKKQLLGAIILQDAIKTKAKESVARLQQLGIKVVLITGDNERVAQEVANELKIDSYFAKVLPQDKYKKVQELQRKGGVVMMVGDGVNDAPALTQADIGVAIGSGTDVALESGDVVLTSSDPAGVVRYILLARKLYSKMRQNLFWALGYNVVAIPAAAGLFIPLGFQLRPEIGALLMSLSSVVVVLNALTLKSFK